MLVRLGVAAIVGTVTSQLVSGSWPNVQYRNYICAAPERKDRFVLTVSTKRRDSCGSSEGVQASTRLSPLVITMRVVRM